ncbi:hypothetical protein, partial [Ureibacillus terrenus]|uniref:hypothetical protein n=1 Tax=Ureibacillus terrenus TaxID=118246 RepID=UPI002E24E34F|nr:hypothetical protein [Ureibacillus terrenus]
ADGAGKPELFLASTLWCSVFKVHSFFRCDSFYIISIKVSEVNNFLSGCFRCFYSALKALLK